jgi:hypothetical protein
MPYNLERRNFGLEWLGKAVPNTLRRTYSARSRIFFGCSRKFAAATPEGDAQAARSWIEDPRAFGTVPDVKLGELLGVGVSDHASTLMVTPAGALDDPALFSPFVSGTQEAPALPIASLADDKDYRLSAHFIASLHALGERLSSAYAFDGLGAQDLTYVMTNDPRPVGFQGPIGDTPLVAQGE